MTGHDSRAAAAAGNERTPASPAGAATPDTGDLDGVDEALALVGPRPDDETGPAAPAGGGPAAHRRRAAAWSAARARAAEACHAAAPRTHRVPLDEALGQVLAEPLTALCDLPSFDTSAMDGWAVAGPGPWTLRGDGSILAGHSDSGPLFDGTAVRIATGARIPRRRQPSSAVNTPGSTPPHSNSMPIVR